MPGAVTQGVCRRERASNQCECGSSGAQALKKLRPAAQSGTGRFCELLVGLNQPIADLACQP